jgi:hypothetical protein
MSTLKELRDTYLRALCVIIHNAETVVLFEDINKFPKELHETTKIVVNFLAESNCSLLETLILISKGKATLKDYIIIADSKNLLGEKMLAMITLRLLKEGKEQFTKDQDIVIEEN